LDRCFASNARSSCFQLLLIVNFTSTTLLITALNFLWKGALKKNRLKTFLRSYHTSQPTNFVLQDT
jgi:hypothetical protein